MLSIIKLIFVLFIVCGLLGCVIVEVIDFDFLSVI